MIYLVCSFRIKHAYLWYFLNRKIGLLIQNVSAQCTDTAIAKNFYRAFDFELKVNCDSQPYFRVVCDCQEDGEIIYVDEHSPKLLTKSD